MATRLALFPVLSVIALPHAAQKQMPVRRVGPLTTRGAVSAGLRDLRNACTASNSAASMIGGTAISTISASGLRSPVFDWRMLNRWRPTYVVRVSTLWTPPTRHRPPSRVRMPAALRCFAMDLTPIGPDVPSPPRARRKISRTVSAWTGSISRIFLVRWPRCSAASTIRYPVGGSEPFQKPSRAFSFIAPQRVLGVLLGLILVEQRHDLADHVAHRIVAELLGNRDEPHAVLGKPADVELKLELVAEEAAEAVNQDHVERWRLAGGGVDHALEFGPPIIGGGGPGLDKVGDDRPATRGAAGLGLAALIRDGKVALGLAAG